LAICTTTMADTLIAAVGWVPWRDFLGVFEKVSIGRVRRATLNTVSVDDTQVTIKISLRNLVANRRVPHGNESCGTSRMPKHLFMATMPRMSSRLCRRPNTTKSRDY
jgi:hypothetical protein